MSKSERSSSKSLSNNLDRLNNTSLFLDLKLHRCLYITMLDEGHIPSTLSSFPTVGGSRTPADVSTCKIMGGSRTGGCNNSRPDLKVVQLIAY